MSRLRVVLSVGERVLLPSGIGIVVAVARDGYQIANAAGEVRDVNWTELAPVHTPAPDGERAVHRLLNPWWHMLDHAAREQALDRLEVVHEITTGFRDGHAALAREGEPVHPYGPTFGASIHAR